jgi:hypothetical protein
MVNSVLESLKSRIKTVFWNETAKGTATQNEPSRFHSAVHMRIVEDSLFFDLECADAQTVFAMGAVFREHTPLHARTPKGVKRKI